MVIRTVQLLDNFEGISRGAYAQPPVLHPPWLISFSTCNYALPGWAKPNSASISNSVMNSPGISCTRGTRR